MIDLGISKLALIGAVALVVIGPEKLPKVARTVGALLGKAQRYVADVKAEVNRSMDLEVLKKMKDSMESAARDVEQSAEQGFQRIEHVRHSACGVARLRVQRLSRFQPGMATGCRRCGMPSLDVLLASP